MIGLLLAVLLLAGSGWGADVSPSEYKLKAAFLYHFSQFVDWPDGAFAEEKSPFIIGVLGDNPFGSDLERTVEGKAIGAHRLQVQVFRSWAEATNHCHILFISSSEQKKFSEILTALGDSEILTVGEADSFGGAGGMIQFIFEGNKIRFRVNETAAARANLKVSAKLLSLASHAAH